MNGPAQANSGTEMKCVPLHLWEVNLILRLRQLRDREGARLVLVNIPEAELMIVSRAEVLEKSKSRV